MKTVWTQVGLLLAAMAVQAGDAQAQAAAGEAPARSSSHSVTNQLVAAPGYYYVPNPNYHRYQAATAAESYLRGMAAMTYASAQFNRLRAEANVINAEARRREIANRELAVGTYFAIRQAKLAQLKKHVRDVDPMDYTYARRFIESLAYDARSPVS